MITSPLRRRVAARVSEPVLTPRPETPLGGVRDAFSWHAAKVLAENVTVTPAAEIEIASWPGREVHLVDFLLEIGGRRVAVECCGMRSLVDHQRHRRRDARLVAAGAVDAVYRISGSDPVAHIHDALLLIANWEKTSGAGRYAPDLFSPRGRFNLSLLAGQEARSTSVQADRAAAMVNYPEMPPRRRRRAADPEARPFLIVQRFDRRHPAAWSEIQKPAPRPLAGFATVAA